MATELPDPLTKPDCDLRGIDWMKLHGHRLFGSEFWSRASDAEFRAGFKLWWAAFQQVPAGSLPDDDVVLCRLADLGRDVKGWKAIRKMALHGFILCSDGRLYHPTVCEVAKEASEKRIKDRDRKARMRGGKSGTERGGPTDGPEDVPRDNGGGDRGTGGGTNVPCPVDDPPTDTVLSRGQAAETPLETRRDESKERKQAATPAFVSQSARDPSMPRRSDPPNAWMHLTPRAEVDDTMVTRPVVGGAYLDIAADAVCDAAGINDANWRGDWRPLIRWLSEGFDLHGDILPAIRRVAARPSYRAPRFLTYFDQAVRESRNVAA